MQNYVKYAECDKQYTEKYAIEYDIKYAKNMQNTQNNMQNMSI